MLFRSFHAGGLQGTPRRCRSCGSEQHRCDSKSGGKISGHESLPWRCLGRRGKRVPSRPHERARASGTRGYISDLGFCVCLPMAPVLPLREAGTSVRRRFLGNSWTSHGLPVVVNWCCHTLGTIADRERIKRQRHCRIRPAALSRNRSGFGGLSWRRGTKNPCCPP